MELERIKRKLPLTIQKGNIHVNKNSSKSDFNSQEKFIFVKKINSNIIPEGFYKPISKMITINESE
ncbi:hypothetical protein [Polaribacter sp. IC073]|uniref:hypothetical protein n=1 Tax=Polaribacter sp. IC073 TaxID=2508540 RepID=UPI0011BF52C6|nr:hypothetical protein [Polaribacter sp. IC073]TXD49764.1 hypothetical protein ES045_00845 [Polaribacter sp. IC073]